MVDRLPEFQGPKYRTPLRWVSSHPAFVAAAPPRVGNPRDTRPCANISALQPRHLKSILFQVGNQSCLLFISELDQWWAHLCPAGIGAPVSDGLLERRNHWILLEREPDRVETFLLRVGIGDLGPWNSGSRSTIQVPPLPPRSSMGRFSTPPSNSDPPSYPP